MATPCTSIYRQRSFKVMTNDCTAIDRGSQLSGVVIQSCQEQKLLLDVGLLSNCNRLLYLCVGILADVEPGRLTTPSVFRPERPVQPQPRATPWVKWPKIEFSPERATQFRSCAALTGRIKCCVHIPGCCPGLLNCTAPSGRKLTAI